MAKSSIIEEPQPNRNLPLSPSLKPFMSKPFSSIRALLVAPAPQHLSTDLTVSLGVVLDNNAVFWSHCPFFNESQETFGSISQLVDEIVRPVLTGQRLDGLVPLFDTLLTLERTVTLAHTVTVDKSGTVSRREILLGTFTDAEPEPETVYIDETRPLPVALTTGLMTLLLKTQAALTGNTAVSLLSTLYQTPLHKLNPRPLHLTLPYGVEQPLFTPSLLSMGYAAPNQDDEVLLGRNGQIYQGHVRRLKAHLRGGEHKGKYLYLPLGGAFGRLYDNNVGRILGAAAGLERAVKPCSVWLEDPILHPEQTRRERLLEELSGFLRMRKMTTRLAAHHGVVSSAAVRALIDLQSVHTIRLDLAQFRSFSDLIEALKLCKESQVEFVLGGTDTSPELLAWLGILFGARLVYTAHVEQTAVVSTEMFRTAMALNNLSENI